MKALHYMLKLWRNIRAKNFAILTPLDSRRWESKLETECNCLEEERSESIIDAQSPTNIISPLDPKKLKTLSELAQRLR